MSYDAVGHSHGSPGDLIFGVDLDYHDAELLCDSGHLDIYMGGLHTVTF